MTSIFKKTLMSLGVIALLFFSSTASGKEIEPQHGQCECPDFVY